MLSRSLGPKLAVGGLARAAMRALAGTLVRPWALLALLGQRLANLTRLPRGQGGLLFTGGLGVLLWQAVELERGLASLAGPAHERRDHPGGQRLPKVVLAHSDESCPLPLYPP